ncbi:hypothetical protein QJS66_14610 [Kocuria rhizophila]|nr:hypothetical protein QJS66_14610 [Kocuria rhizophila]
MTSSPTARPAERPATGRLRPPRPSPVESPDEAESNACAGRHRGCTASPTAPDRRRPCAWPTGDAVVDAVRPGP